MSVYFSHISSPFVQRINTWRTAVIVYITFVVTFRPLVLRIKMWIAALVPRFKTWRTAVVDNVF